MTYHRAHARNSDPSTSVEAADKASDGLTHKQQIVLDVMTAYGQPLTDEQLVDMLPRWSPSGVRSRRAELVERGLVVNSGATTLTRMGNKTIIWKVRA